MNNSKNNDDLFSSNEQENDLNHLSLTPDNDEVAKRQHRSQPSKERTAGQKTRQEPEFTANSSVPSSHTNTPAKGGGGGSSALTGLLFLMVLGLGGFSGWMFLQMEQFKQSLTVKESEFDTKVSSLGSQLSEKDQAAADDVSNIQKTLKTHQSEIKKLWGVSYDTNKKAINKNKTSIDELSKKVGTQNSTVNQSIKKTNQNVSSLEKKLATAEKKISTTEKSAIDKASKAVDTKLNALKTSVTNSNQELDIQIKTALDEIALLQSKDNASALDQRIQTNEQAIKAIDATRVKLNRDMQRLQTQLNQYKQLVESLQKQVGTPTN